MPFVLEAWPKDGKLEALVVGDVLHCGVCKPKKEPVTLDKP